MLQCQLSLNLHLCQIAYQHCQLKVKFLSEKTLTHLPDLSTLAHLFAAKIGFDTVGDELIEVYQIILLLGEKLYAYDEGIGDHL